jgi:sec-independent protein translocase protein TatB
MFDVGWSEMLVIAIVLIVVVGPKDLPRMLRQFGRSTSKLRAMAGDFRRQFDEALKEAELDDVTETLSSVRKLNPMNEIRKHLAPIEEVGQQVRAGLDEAMKPQSKVTPAENAAEPVPAEPLKNGAAGLPGETAAPVVETGKPKRKTGRAKAPAAKSGAAKSGAAKASTRKSAAVKSSTATVAKASPPKAAEVKTVSRKTSPKAAASRPPVSKTTTAKASKAAPASAKRAPARTGPAGRKNTGSAR